MIGGKLLTGEQQSLIQNIIRIPKSPQTQTLDSNKDISERRRSPSRSSIFTRLASFVNLSFSNDISLCWRLLISFISDKLLSSCLI